MKQARPILAAAAVGIVLAVVFGVFAVELASAQTRSRNEIKTEVQDRAVLAASLIDSLFGTAEQQKTQYSSEFGSTIDQAKLAATAQNEFYSAVTDSSGAVLAATSGYNPAKGLGIPSAVLARLARQQTPYYLGDLAPSGPSYVADLAVPFPTSGGERVLVTALDPSTLGAFFSSELGNVPGVKGETNYLVDGNGLVVASSNPGTPTGATPAGPVGQAVHRSTGEKGGVYFQKAALANSRWDILLAAPAGALFASVDGVRELVPWIIFSALILVAIVAVVLGWRVIRAAEEVSEVNERLAAVNSELSTANDSLHRRAAELARSNEDLESFASIASHDLQEPLRKVRTFTEQLTVFEAERLSDKGRDYLQRANAAAERMQRLIEDLLKFSRVSTQGRPFERVDLARVTERVLVDLDVEEAGAQVVVGPLPVISADPLQMQQLLQNLISNALKFRRAEVAPEIRISAVIDGDDLQLSVADNGIGFEPRYAARIFRIFERLHGRTDYPGTGIGLALCRKIADRHGGTIEAHSDLGKGATFTITLPASHPDGSFGVGGSTAAVGGIETRAGV